MKMFTLVCILAASAMATAQTTPATKATETFKPEVKKVFKKKKKTVNDAATVIETKKTVVDQAEVKTTTTTVTQNTAGTSETVIQTTVAPTKNWSAALATDVWVGTQAANTDIGKANIGSENYIRGLYKISPDTTLGVRQYFDHTRVSGAENKAMGSYTALTAQHRFDGILGSKDIKPLFYIFLPTESGAEHFRRALGLNERPNYQGYLRMDAEIAYDINPLFTVSYLLSPRQYLFSTETDSSGKKVENISRLVHMANLYANINDNVVPYASLGMDQQSTTSDSTMFYEEVYAALGASFTYGVLTITPEVNNHTAIRSNKAYRSDSRVFDANDLYYELYTTISF